MTEPAERTINRLIGNLEALRNEHQQAEHTLCDQRRRIDSWTSRNNNEHIKGGTTTSTTERAATARLAIDEQLTAWRQELDAATLIIRNLRHECQTTTRRQGAPVQLELPPAPISKPIGRQGADQWADNACHNIPTRGPLCDKCSKREYRWRTSNGLPPRRDGVYAGDLTP
jgi:hypothetical protein